MEDLLRAPVRKSGRGGVGRAVLKLCSVGRGVEGTLVWQKEEAGCRSGFPFSPHSRHHKARFTLRSALPQGQLLPCSSAAPPQAGDQAQSRLFKFVLSPWEKGREAPQTRKRRQLHLVFVVLEMVQGPGTG